MKILFGTTNKAKLNAMKERLQRLDVEIIGLNEVEIRKMDIVECGNDPLENARIKALAYYEELKMPVFSCDSGLYCDGLPDELQPGVHVRNVNGKYLTDDQMVEYYSDLSEKMGGKMTARYKNAICFVCNDACMYEHMGDDISSERFIISAKPHSKRTEGFPLDSLSVHIETGKYYFDLEGHNVESSGMDDGFRRFFQKGLENFRRNSTK